MNKYTDKQIVEQLTRLQSIEPSPESLERMNQRVQRLITNTDQKPAKPYGFWSYAAASAAVILIGFGLIYNIDPITTQPIPRWTIPAEPTLTLAQLNAVFENGGQKALDEYLEKAQTQRQPRPESITLQDILQEL